MKKWILAGVAALALGGAGVALAQGDVIAQRKAGMKHAGDTMTAMKVVADAGTSGAQFTGSIDQMIAYFQRVPSLFPSGSGAGDTKAMPEIWNNPTGFTTANNDTIEKLRALRAAAASGDGAAVQAAWRATGPTCGACHRANRAR